MSFNKEFCIVVISYTWEVLLMTKALIHIDYTYDFVADDGALTCGSPAQALEDNLLDITQQFIKHDYYVVFALDQHLPNDPYHPESSLFPPHNLIHTKGQMLYGKMGEYHQSIQHLSNVYTMPKTRYSAFCGTDLELKLRERQIDTLYLVGVCTDICVLHTAIDAYNKGFKLVVYDNGVASFDEVGHAWALSHFKNTLGATVCTFDASLEIS